MAIDFGTVLDAVNADNLFCGINPIEDAIIAHAELAESGQIIRHTDEPAMHHASGIPRAIGFCAPRPRRWRCPARRVERRPCRLFRLGRTRLVAGFPRSELTGHVFAPRRA